MTFKRNVKSIYLGGRCWEWLGRLCERRGGDTRYPGTGVGSGRGQQPASGKSESGNRYTWTHCHATAPHYMPFGGKSTYMGCCGKEGFFTTSNLVSLLWVDLTPLKLLMRAKGAAVDEASPNFTGHFTI